MFANFDLLSYVVCFFSLFIVFVLFFFSTVLVNKDAYITFFHKQNGDEREKSTPLNDHS